jgi:glyoxylase-like metal-dependent hydrolase (beta-lactamase superfamily II)
MSDAVQVGNVSILALSDSEEAYEARRVYPDVSEVGWEPYRDLLGARGTILLNFGSYLIRADARTLLVDTGWGPSHQGRLLAELREAGIALDAIDAVIFTHLHGDHIGWNLVTDGSTPRPRFPRARYLAPEADWRHYTTQPDPAALFREQMLSLAELGVLDLIGGDHVLSASVTTVATPGHTPGHLSVAISSGGEHGFILGDVAITALEAHETDWANCFDWNTPMARATRQAVLDRLEREGTLVAAGHFPKPGFGRFTRSGGRRVWQSARSGISDAATEESP